MAIEPFKAGLVAAMHRPRCDGPAGKLKLTKRQASLHAERLRVKGASGIAYKCRFCGWYHTAQEQTPEAQRRGSSADRPRVRSWGDSDDGES